MAITVGTNSYLTEEDATLYFADKFGYDKWSGEANKPGALISATQQLDLLCNWHGLKSDSDQNLEFPRSYVTLEVDSDPVPQAVKDAQCEIAYSIVDTASVSTDIDDSLTELKAGSVNMKFKATAARNPLINDLVVKLLAPYGSCSFGGAVDVVRT